MCINAALFTSSQDGFSCSVWPTWPRSSWPRWRLEFLGPLFVIRKQQASSRLLIQATKLLVDQLDIGKEAVPDAIISHNGDEIARVALTFLEGPRLHEWVVVRLDGAKAMLN